MRVLISILLLCVAVWLIRRMAKGMMEDGYESADRRLEDRIRLWRRWK